jgi:hypothetical protein
MNEPTPAWRKPWPCTVTILCVFIYTTRYAKSRFELLASFASASALVVTSSPEAETRCDKHTHRCERVLFIGTRFSNLYTAVDMQAEAA